MFNLNNPKLTKQEKEFMLSLQLDKELSKKLEEEKEKGNNICFPSYWVVQTKDLIKFNKGAHQIDNSFDFYAEELEKHHPDFDVILLEGERVEIGEWDKTYKRWSSHSYQRVCVVWINGKFHGFNDEGISISRMPSSVDEIIEHSIEKSLKDAEQYALETNKEELSKEQLDEIRKCLWDEIEKEKDLIEETKKQREDLEFQYPHSFGENAFQGLGIIDIPLHLLNEYEENRVNDWQFIFSNEYEKAIERQLKAREDYYKKGKENRKKIKKYKNTKRKGTYLKSIKKGFGK